MYRILGPKGHLIVRKITPARLKQIMPALKKRFGTVKVILLPPPAPDYRKQVVAWARWGVVNEPRIHYAETRPMPSHLTVPMTTDCSGFATLCYKAAGAADPNGFGYDGSGYTGTLLQHAAAHGKILTNVRKAKPGDLIVYGPGDGAHVAIIVEGGPDPLTVSHGQEAGPELVRVSQDGRQPQRICSYL